MVMVVVDGEKDGGGSASTSDGEGESAVTKKAPRLRSSLCEGLKVRLDGNMKIPLLRVNSITQTKLDVGISHGKGIKQIT